MSILLKDLFLYDPETRKLANEGVANVNDSAQSSHDLDVLRYELETFVCDGEYERGLQIILESFLGNIGQAEQPSAWVSGFFGSGKSHLVKMLRALWVNTRFPDGATAQGIASLPDRIKDLLTELKRAGKRHGGLHAASGTLGAGAGSVRLSLLQIVFRSVNLPEQYPIARFVMWMRDQGILDSVRQSVEEDGHNWGNELDSFLFSESIHAALVKMKPTVFSSVDACANLLAMQYQFVQDITSEDMLKGIRDALSVNGTFPLTILVLDEVQQYIGEDLNRSLAVQEMIEDCSKRFGGKLMVVATGQTAITGTSNLKKLEGRFTISVELSDSDVDEVIRKVILAKKPDKIADIEAFIQMNLGEITRHLADTRIRHRQSDTDDFYKDYPLLPVRRRFWEEAFRVLDSTGTSAQLRNQLAMIHKVIKESAGFKLGYVIPADYLYFDTAKKLLQSKMLNRRYYDLTIRWNEGSEDEKLMARACAIVYLINKIVDRNRELGLKATVDTIADLMVIDLSKGSAPLRSKLPELMDSCPLLMKIGDEYRMQTEESTAWNDEFASQKAVLENESYRITGDRTERLTEKVQDHLRKIQITQGASKVKRDVLHYFDANSSPKNTHKQITIWIRDGWTIQENSVILEARQAGNSSATIHVYIPKKNTEELFSAILEYKAADATLDRRGIPTNGEGLDAYNAMKTTRDQAEARINGLLEDVLAGAKVYQSGGNEIHQNSLEAMVREAVNLSLDRMYQYFEMADNEKWGKVFERAKGGATDALSLIGYRGEVPDNPVCKEILSFIGSGKKGTDIRTHFQDSPYGWPQDAIDGALLVLLVSGSIRAEDSRARAVKATEIERKAIGITNFKVETVVLTTQQKIALRRLMSKLKINANQANLSEFADTFLMELKALAEQAGGEAPKPEKPDTSFIDDLRSSSGNDQLLAIHLQAESIERSIDNWEILAKKIENAWPKWSLLENLARHAAPVDQDRVFLDQVEMIKKDRQLLEEPDLIEPLTKGLNQLLRDELNTLQDAWDEVWDTGEALLTKDDNWNKLPPEQKYKLRSDRLLLEENRPVFEVEDSVSIIKTLDSIGLDNLKDRIAAMPGRYSEMLVEAARLMEPKAQIVTIKKPTLRSDSEVDDWLAEVEATLKNALEKGPVVIR